MASVVGGIAHSGPAEPPAEPAGDLRAELAETFLMADGIDRGESLLGAREVLPGEADAGQHAVGHLRRREGEHLGHVIVDDPFELGSILVDLFKRLVAVAQRLRLVVP